MHLTDAILKFALLGAEWVMWLLVALSVISVTIILERLFYFGKRRVAIDHLAPELERRLRAGNIELARDLVRNHDAIECIVVDKGLEQAPRGQHAVAEAMQGAKLRQRIRMERQLSFLGTLGSNAPFVGLLGTVLGIIKASHDLTLSGAGKAPTANAAMAGVFEALVATAVGLFVAIPAVMAYNFFLRMVKTRIAQADALAHLVLGNLKPDAPPAPQQAHPHAQRIEV
jgi:biopolymer transport protein ExbB